MASLESQLSSAINEALASLIDEDICEYISSTLIENPHDEDARENVKELIRGSLEEGDADQIIENFFKKLSLDDTKENENEASSLLNDEDGQTMKKLDKAMTLKDHDIQTFAGGISAEGITSSSVDHEDEVMSSVASFYATMIDISNNEAVISERNRRKEKQKALREAAEEAERRRAIEDVMNVLDDDAIEGENPDELLDAANDNSADVHIRNLDLPNLRGGGPDLLQNASLTLAKGRRYGLLGINGSGKTTFLTYLAQRKVENAVPKKMTMLLVRQEIVGNDLTAVETVLKSDVKREAVKRFISWCEAEIDRLENGENTNANVDDSKTDVSEKSKTESKGKQKLLEKKKAKQRQAAKAKVGSSDTVIKMKKENIEYQKTRISEKLTKAYSKLNEIEEAEGGDPEPRARKVLSGMGFTTEMQDKKTKEMSGGWRMRVSIACALFASPSLLLLDEPTNHLDVESCMWLERYLTKEFDGTLVIVSHDRHFLNEVVTDVVHFDKCKLVTYRGDITNFEAVRDDNLQRQIRLRENQEAKKAHLQKYIDLHSQAGENGVKAARQRKSKMKKLEKVGMMAQEGKKWKASYDGEVEEVEEVVEEEKVELKFPDPGSFDGDIVGLDQVSFGYTPEKLLLKNVDLTIGIKSRYGLLGRNGTGKSTLIKVIVGQLQALSGNVRIDTRAKIEYLAQHQLEQLDPDSTPMQTMIERYPGDRSNNHILTLRRHLANFGISGEVLPKQRIHTMSGGQKCRLCLASAMYRKPHLLILDERK
jgi:ATP-binding cassette, subfamily F, member 3